MSRFSDDWDDYEPDYNNASDLWYANLQRALGGKRGQQALAELREALLALPEKRLISGALCTVNAEKRGEEIGKWSKQDLIEKVGEQGEGVCAIGAFAWFKKVRAGTDPSEAFAELPTVLDVDGDGAWRTTNIGQSVGLMTPEQRYEAYVEWIDKQLADEPVAA